MTIVNMVGSGEGEIEGEVTNIVLNNGYIQLYVSEKNDIESVSTIYPKDYGSYKYNLTKTIVNVTKPITGSIIGSDNISETSQDPTTNSSSTTGQARNLYGHRIGLNTFVDSNEVQIYGTSSSLQSGITLYDYLTNQLDVGEYEITTKVKIYFSLSKQEPPTEYLNKLTITASDNISSSSKCFSKYWTPTLRIVKTVSNVDIHMTSHYSYPVTPPNPNMMYMYSYATGFVAAPYNIYLIPTSVSKIG